MAVKDVFINDVEGYKHIGYNTPDDFLNAFYFDFDVRIGEKGLVTGVAAALSFVLAALKEKPKCNSFQPADLESMLKLIE